MNNIYDIHEPTIGHFNRFQSKLAKRHVPKKKNSWYKYSAIAAIFLLFLYMGLGNNPVTKGIELAEVSPKMGETQDYFNTVIYNELGKIAKIKNSKNENIINDAFLQLQHLEEDYNKQKLALATNTENKTIIYAMINNYQQRIDVLQNLLKQLNDFNNINIKYNESNNL